MRGEQNRHEGKVEIQEKQKENEQSWFLSSLTWAWLFHQSTQISRIGSTLHAPLLKVVWGSLSFEPQEFSKHMTAARTMLKRWPNLQSGTGSQVTIQAPNSIGSAIQDPLCFLLWQLACTTFIFQYVCLFETWLPTEILALLSQKNTWGFAPPSPIALKIPWAFVSSILMSPGNTAYSA